MTMGVHIYVKSNLAGLALEGQQPPLLSVHQSALGITITMCLAMSVKRHVVMGSCMFWSVMMET